MTNSRESERDWAAWIETLSVFALIVVYIWRIRLFHPWRWLVIAAIVAASHAVRGEGARKLGLGWRQFRQALRALAPWVLALALALLAGGALLGTINPVVWRRAPGSLGVYLVWGILQQWLLNGYFLSRLRQATAGSGRAPLLAATLFSMAHAPNWFLMTVAGAGGYAAALIYLRYRSLWMLGLAHGLIGYLLNLVVPDEISGRFLVGPRYVLHQFGTYPEQLL